MSVFRSTRIFRPSPAFVFLTCLLVWAQSAYAGVGFRVSLTDSSSSNTLTRRKLDGLSVFGKRAIVDIPMAGSAAETKFDSSFSSVTMDFHAKETHLLQPTILDMAEYEQLKFAADVNSYRAATWQKNAKASTAASSGEGIAIDLPYRIQNKTFRRLFGGDNVGVRVQGNISINGNIRNQKFSELQAANQQNTNTAFRIDMVQQFTITGKVGQKVEVKVDQNSERMFDFENSLKLTYTGDEDEIVQKVEAGNVALNLGTKLATFSGKNTGLFGLKTDLKAGPLKLTGIASLERGQKNRQSPSKDKKQAQFYEQDFLQNVYFFLTNTDSAGAPGQRRRVANYRENYRHYNAGLNHVQVPAGYQIKQIEVYVETGGMGESGTTPLWGKAYAMPYVYQLATNDTLAEDGDHVVSNWKRLIPDVDYTVDVQLGFIRLKQPATGKLACAFATAGGQGYTGNVPADTFGTLVGLDARNLSLLLLKNSNPDSTNSTWDLMFRNIYSLQASGLDQNNFKLTMYRSAASGTQDEQSPVVIGQAESYLSYFGLDQSGDGGAGGPDGKVDNNPAIIDWMKGELTFFDLTPFDPSGVYVGNEFKTFGDVRQLADAARQAGSPDSSNYVAHYLYHEKTTQFGQYGRKWRFVTEFQGSSSVFNLGPLVLEGSEEVTLNGQTLQRGVDYTVDYSSGQLRILNDNAKAAGADLQITYESGQVFQLDKTTLLGARAEYGLWQDSYIGGMVLYLNQQTLDKRVRIGNEPIRNTLWDANTSLKFQPNFLTRAVDALPLIHTEAASQITIDGEFAKVFPDPNSLSNPATGDFNGLAYLDDFEGSRRSTPLGLSRRMWTISSIPVTRSPSNDQGAPIDSTRGRLRWWNPNTRDQVLVKDVFPEREVNSQVANTLQSLMLDFEPDTSRQDPEHSWGGLMRYLGDGYADQSRSQYLEFWLRVPSREVLASQPNARLVCDLGTISEDALPNDSMNSEDRPLAGMTADSPIREYGNGLLDPDEDVGMDGKRGIDPADSARWNGPTRPLVPSWDDWKHDAGSSDFLTVNGTEGNRNDESGGYPDTEDLNGDNFLNRENNYFSYTFDLNNQQYIAGSNGRDNPRWRMFRIPITPKEPGIRSAVGNADLTAVRWARIYLTGFKQHTVLELVQMDIVSNEWLPVASGRDTTEHITPAVINTHENPGQYDPPPGVQGEIDPITNLRQREQSLVMKINSLPEDSTVHMHQAFVAKNLYQEYNLQEYQRLKMFVHGGGPNDAPRAFPDSNFQVILRLGQNYSTIDANYYEIIRTVGTGWDPATNSIDIALTQLSLLHSHRGVAITNGRYAEKYGGLPQDSLAIQGNPTLSRIGFIAVGVRALDSLKHFGTNYGGVPQEIWVDELRVSDIHKEPGSAAQVNTSIQLADFISLSGGYQNTDAQFHNVNVRINPNQSSTSGWTGNASVNLQKAYLERFGFHLPLSFSYAESNTIPRIIPNTDTRIEPSQAPDSIKSHSTQFSYRVQFSKTGNSKNPLVRWSLEKLTGSWDYAKSTARDVNTQTSNAEQTGAQVSYTFPTAKGRGISPLWFLQHVPVLGMIGSPQVYYKPTKLLVTGSATRHTEYRLTRPQYSVFTDSTGQQQVKATQLPTRSFSFQTIRTLNTGFAPFRPLTIDISRTHKAILDSTGTWGNIARWDWGHENEISQNITNVYSPEFAPWLKPTVNYGVGYSWANQRVFQATNNSASQSVSNQTTFGTDLQLDFNQIFGASSGRRDRDGRSGRNGHDRDGGANPENGDPSEGPRRPGEGPQTPMRPGMPGGVGGLDRGAHFPAHPGMSRADTTSGSGQDSLRAVADSSGHRSNRRSEEHGSPFAGIGKIFNPVKTVLRAFDPISLSYDNTGNHSIGGTTGQAAWKYQLGLTQDPGLAMATDSAGNPLTTVAPVRRRTDDITARSGLRLTKSVRTSFTYANRSQKTISSLSTGSNDESIFWISKSAGMPFILPFPDVTVEWSGLEQFKFLSGFTKSVSLSSGLGNKMTSQWSGSPSNVTTRAYTRDLRPLIGVNVSWKGDIESQIQFNNSNTYTDQASVGTKQRTTDRQVTAQVSYSIRRGFRLPLFFMKSIKLENQTTFSLAVDYRSQKNEGTASAASDQFALQGATSSWSVSPKMVYSFSQTVQGQAYVQVQQNQNDVTKSKSRLFEFGVQVNIAIRG